jgi:hypothetical protein
MSQIITDKAGLMEPNLWVPFKQPVNFARLNPYWKYYNNLFYVYYPVVNDTLDLVSKTQGTREGTFAIVPHRYGTNIQPIATSSYLQTNVGNFPGEPYNTVLFVGIAFSSASACRIFSTRRNSANSGYYCGIFWTLTTTTFTMYYGDDTGSSAGDYRLLQTTGASAFPSKYLVSICGCFRSSTTGIVYINGRPMSLSTGGTGGAVAGTGNFTLYDYQNYNNTIWPSIYLLVVFNTTLPEGAMQSLSADPYQMFTPL